MRLLFVGHSSGMLGAERSMVDIVSGAVADGHQVTAVVPGAGPLVPALRNVGASVVELPVRAWMGAWHWFPPIGLTRLAQARRSTKSLAQVIAQSHAEVVVTNTSVLPGGAWAAHRLGIPHMWIVRESLRDNPQLRSALPKRTIAGQLIAGSEVLCTISPYVEQQVHALARDVHPHSYRVSPNPAVDLEALATPPDVMPRVILLPGYFSREKGQHLAILAVFRARRQGADLSLRIVGQGGRGFTKLLHVLVRVLRLRAHVHILGWTDDLEPEYDGAHFVLTTSRNEAFGRTVVEAFARGRPVIGLDRGATTELLRHGGGLIAAPTSAALGAVVLAAARMPRSEYEHLHREALARGNEFRETESQYQGFRRALSSLMNSARE